MTQTAEKPANPVRKKPEGFNTRVTGDIVGFWDIEEQGGINIIPRAAKLSDSTIEPSKPSMFIICELMEKEEITVYRKDDKNPKEKIAITAKHGDYIGIWAKSGMRDIRNCGGKEIWIEYVGEKDIGKKSPLKVFEISSNNSIVGKLIPIIEDNRTKSKKALTFLHSEDVDAVDF